MTQVEQLQHALKVVLTQRNQSNDQIVNLEVALEMANKKVLELTKELEIYHESKPTTVSSADAPSNS